MFDYLQADGVSDETSTPEILVPHLGKADYSGKTLRVLALDTSSDYVKTQISPDVFIPEPLYDAVLKRNELLKIEYGFDIQCEYKFFNEYNAHLRNYANLSIDSYDLYAADAYTLSLLAPAGYVQDLLDIPNSHMQLDKEWWDKDYNNDLSIANKLFVATGDIFFLDDQFTQSIYFNKDIIKQYNLDNPYALVESGDWTLDKMYAMAKIVAKDDGDDVMNFEGDDIWGLVSGRFDLYNLLIACNSPMVKKDYNTDEPYLAMKEQHSISAFEKVFDIYADEDSIAYAERFYSWDDPLIDKVYNSFSRGKTLFFISSINDISEKYKNSTIVDYGVLPLPKYNKSQENYISPVNQYYFYSLAIPKYEYADFDFITFAVEAMAYTSKTLVTPVYYDTLLKHKRADDEETVKIFEPILANKTSDLALIFKWDDCNNYYSELLTKKSNDIVTKIEERKAAFEAAINKTLEDINKYKTRMG